MFQSLVLARAVASLALSAGSAGAYPAPTAFVAPSGSDANPCTATAPCLSMDRAYHLVPAGSVVELAGGSYPPQRLTHDAAKVSATADVVFRAAPGRLAALGGLTLDGADHVTVVGHSPNSNLTRLGALAAPVDGITLRPQPAAMDTGGDLMLVNCADENTFRALDMRQFGVSGSDGTTIDGGSVGGYDDSGGDSFVGPPYQLRGTSWCTGHNPRSTHITHLVFHDVLRTNLPTAHPDCLQLYGSDGLVVDFDSFARCGTSHIMDRPSFAGSVEDHQVFDHNLLGPLVEGGNSIAAGAGTDAMGSLTISNNVCVGVPCVSNLGASFAALAITGNWWGYLSRYGCSVLLGRATRLSGNGFAAGQYPCGSQASVIPLEPDPFGG